jgi:hypothetical protein
MAEIAEEPLLDEIKPNPNIQIQSQDQQKDNLQSKNKNFEAIKTLIDFLKKKF